MLQKAFFAIAMLSESTRYHHFKISQVFPGTLDHLSLPNYSKKSRHTFQLHLVEGPCNEGIYGEKIGAEHGVTWSKGNWLQYRGKPSEAGKPSPFHVLPVGEKVAGFGK